MCQWISESVSHGLQLSLESARSLARCTNSESSTHQPSSTTVNKPQSGQLLFSRWLKPVRSPSRTASLWLPTVNERRDTLSALAVLFPYYISHMLAASHTSVISSLASCSLSGLLAHSSLASVSLFFCNVAWASCQRCHAFIRWSNEPCGFHTHTCYSNLIYLYSAFAQWQLEQAPADPRYPGSRIMLVRKQIYIFIYKT